MDFKSRFVGKTSLVGKTGDIAKETTKPIERGGFHNDARSTRMSAYSLFSNSMRANSYKPGDINTNDVYNQVESYLNVSPGNKQGFNGFFANSDISGISTRDTNFSQISEISKKGKLGGLAKNHGIGHPHHDHHHPHHHHPHNHHPHHHQRTHSYSTNMSPRAFFPLRNNETGIDISPSITDTSTSNLPKNTAYQKRSNASSPKHTNKSPNTTYPAVNFSNNSTIITADHYLPEDDDTYISRLQMRKQSHDAISVPSYMEKRSRRSEKLLDLSVDIDRNGKYKSTNHALNSSLQTSLNYSYASDCDSKSNNRRRRLQSIGLGYFRRQSSSGVKQIGQNGTGEQQYMLGNPRRVGQRVNGNFGDSPVKQRKGHHVGQFYGVGGGSGAAGGGKAVKLSNSRQLQKDVRQYKEDLLRSQQVGSHYMLQHE
eukprot:CAMPEP_0115039310 /NCGR_PEP_ID=MMETSP0216-20121206/43951_1 /TAXON_ID=223996 /ORGANISM="Protocruzia adherens, Strain Boccale" /LENGTH=426 /DNA_ID=CAMNT_0002419923 /DNA_START=227 /DNA_END=1507 /DNA_ORIENTATION=+